MKTLGSRETKVSRTFSAKHPQGRSECKGTGHLFSARSVTMSVVTLQIWAILLAAALSAADQNVVVVLDDSGSMDQRMSGGQRVRKMDAAKQALLSVLEQLPDEAHVGVLALNSIQGGNHWIVPLGPVDRASIQQQIGGIRATGGTPLGAAMKEAADALLENRTKQIYGTYRLLIVTDGEAGDRDLVEAYLPAIKARGLITDVIGVDMPGSHSLATQVNTYRRADDPASLASAIAEVFAETSDDSGDAGQSDYDLLSGLSDEVAAAALIGLTDTNNLPIGQQESEPVAGLSTAAPVAPLPGTGPRSSQPAPASPGLGLGAVCIGFIVMLVLVVGGLLGVLSSLGRRHG